MINYTSWIAQLDRDPKQVYSGMFYGVYSWESVLRIALIVWHFSCGDTANTDAENTSSQISLQDQGQLCHKQGLGYIQVLKQLLIFPYRVIPLQPTRGNIRAVLLCYCHLGWQYPVITVRGTWNTLPLKPLARRDKSLALAKNIMELFNL